VIISFVVGFKIGAFEQRNKERLGEVHENLSDRAKV
jgi:hypothetical protein